MELHLEHEIAQAELGIPETGYPNTIKQSIKSLKALIKRYITDVPVENRNPDQVIKINAMSARIADEMQDHYEAINNLETNENQNMLTGKELERAQAVGLDASATLEQVIELEKQIAATEDLAKRAKAAGLSESALEAEVIEAENALAAKAAEDQETATAAAALAKRATASGLAETATLEEVEEAEKIAAEDAENKKKKNNDPAAGQPVAAAPAPKHWLDDLEETFF